MTLLFYYTLLIMFFYTTVGGHEPVGLLRVTAAHVLVRHARVHVLFLRCFPRLQGQLHHPRRRVRRLLVLRRGTSLHLHHHRRRRIPLSDAGRLPLLPGRTPRRSLCARGTVGRAVVGRLQFIENPQWREFVYYNLRAVLQLVCYGLLAWWYTHSPDPERRSIMKSHRTAFFWAIGLTCGIILENVYVQLSSTPALPRAGWDPRRSAAPWRTSVHLLRAWRFCGRVGVPALRPASCPKATILCSRSPSIVAAFV